MDFLGSSKFPKTTRYFCTRKEIDFVDLFWLGWVLVLDLVKSEGLTPGSALIPESLTPDRRGGP